MLGAQHQTKLTLIIEGSDAQMAMKDLEEFLNKEMENL